MFKKTMKFDNLDGEEVTQTFYFNYNKKEIAELLEFKQLEEKLRILTIPVEESGLSQIDNNKQAYDIFQDLILDAYGKKGDDNVTFIKNEELRNYWKSHVAFVELIFEFLENPPLAAEFIENCLPTKLVAKAKEDIAAQNEGNVTEASLHEMMQEAERRQKDPETRIEPGPEAAAEALGANPELAELASSVAEGGGTPAKTLADLTEADILSMDDVAFEKLPVHKLSHEQLQVAFRRKNQG